MLVLHHQPPTFTVQDAERIADERYGLHVSAALFPGEHDQNFLLKSATGEEFILKIARAAEQYEILD
jgi:Ser/Thr protein kinase RdoA (MazF antagonist)